MLFLSACTVPVMFLMQLNAEYKSGMMSRVGTSPLGVWFDSETGFQGLQATVFIPEHERKRSKYQSIIKLWF